MGIVVLGLEAIGDDMVQFHELHQAKMRELGLPDGLRRSVGIGPVLRRPWVAEITGRDPTYGWARQFLRGQKDYSHANSIGSRGIMIYYHLQEGAVYEVNDWAGWSSVDRYFCRAEGNKIVRMTEREVATRV